MKWKKIVTSKKAEPTTVARTENFSREMIFFLKYISCKQRLFIQPIFVEQRSRHNGGNYPYEYFVDICYRWYIVFEGKYYLKLIIYTNWDFQWHQ